jgi:Tfp pilus assembly protein PilV
MRTAHSEGFTLIEVTLAAVVISMGLLALFGLGHFALRNAKAAEDNTRAALLADDVFASLRAVSENLCASNNPAAWTAFWTDFAAGSTNLPLQLSTAASFSNRSDNAVWGNGRVCTNNLFSRPEIHRAGLTPLPEWSARYWMDIALTNQMAGAGETNLVRVTLHVVPGLSGDPGESRAFYTHFAEHGTLP